MDTVVMTRNAPMDTSGSAAVNNYLMVTERKFSRLASNSVVITRCVLNLGMINPIPIHTLRIPTSMVTQVGHILTSVPMLANGNAVIQMMIFKD